MTKTTFIFLFIVGSLFTRCVENAKTSEKKVDLSISCFSLQGLNFDLAVNVIEDSVIVLTFHRKLFKDKDTCQVLWSASFYPTEIDNFYTVDKVSIDRRIIGDTAVKDNELGFLSSPKSIRIRQIDDQTMDLDLTDEFSFSDFEQLSLRKVDCQ